MFHWIQVIFKKIVYISPVNILPVVFMGSYHCHMMGSDVCIIEDLDWEVMTILRGCTYALQPVDVDFTKLLTLKTGYHMTVCNWIQQAII